MPKINISKADIKERCRMLSAFDAREAVTASGESNYNQMKLTEQEDTLIDIFITQAVSRIETSMMAITYLQSIIDNDNVTIVISDTLGITGGTSSVASFQKAVMETITAYILTRWYEDKSAQRSNAYRALFEDMLGAAKRIAYKKPMPVLR